MSKLPQICRILVIFIHILQGYKLCTAETTEEPCECVCYKNCASFVPVAFRDSLSECGSFLQYCCPKSDIRKKSLFDYDEGWATNRECGYSNPDGVNFSFVDRGKFESQYGEFPWMVAILIQYTPQAPVFVYRGGGSLIHPKVVLTGSHVVYGQSPSSIKIRAGEWDTLSIDEPYATQDRITDKIVTHEAYDNNTNIWGISLLFITVPIEFGPTINSICLPPLRENFYGQSCFVTGWGKLHLNSTCENMFILKKVPVPIIEYKKCRKQLRTALDVRNFRLHDSFICAGGEEGLDACTGDGGSPLMCPISGEENRYYLAGVVSWGLQCGLKDMPGVYVNPSKMRDWIDLKLVENGITNFSSFTL